MIKKQEKRIAEICSVARSAQRLIMSRNLYTESMFGHTQENKQSEVERPEVLKHDNTPPVTRVPGEHKVGSGSLTVIFD